VRKAAGKTENGLVEMLFKSLVN